MATTNVCQLASKNFIFDVTYFNKGKDADFIGRVHRRNEMRVTVIIALCVLLRPASVQSCKSSSNVLFDDEFDTLNFNLWQHEITAGGGGNNEFQYYTNNRSNSYVRDGILYIRPTLTEDKYDANFVKYGTLSLEGTTPANTCTGQQWNGCERTANYDNGVIINPIQSARLRSVNSFSFRYGKVEFEAQMPSGDWIWPAVWMLPKNNAYGDWPASGEIDILECRGNQDLLSAEGMKIGAQNMGSTLHWGPHWPYNAWYLTHGEKTLTDGSFADSFHKFVMEWTATGLTFYVDGEQILNVSPPNGQSMYDWADFATQTRSENPWIGGTLLAPFDQEYYLILNVAVGGTTGYFPDGVTNNPKPKPWKNDSPTASKDFWDKKSDWYPTWDGENAAMKIKYIKVTSL